MNITSEFFAQSGSEIKIGFADNPAVVTLIPEQIDIETAAKMKRVVLTVEVGGEFFDFESEFVVGEKVVFDISSAWKAVYNRQAPDVDSKGYTALPGKLTCHTEGVVNGELVKRNLGALMSDIYLLKGGVPASIIQQNKWTLPAQAYSAYKDRLTLKPKGGSGEVVNIGDEVWVSGVKVSTDVKVSTNVIKDDLGSVGVKDFAGRKVKVVNDPRRVEFAFVNSFGVVEHASAVVRGAMSMENASTEFGVISEPSFAVKEDTAVSGADSHPTWKMSSGYCSREWLLWWATEFLPRKRSVNRWWMKTANGWLPVVVSAKSNDIYEQAKGGMKSIDFEVKA